MAVDVRNARLIRLPEVLGRTGLSESSLFRKRKSGEFPAPMQLGPRSIAWLESDIDEWIQTRGAA